MSALDCYPADTDLSHFDDAPVLPREEVEHNKIEISVNFECPHCLHDIELDAYDFDEQEENHDCDNCGQPLELKIESKLWEFINDDN